MILAQPVSPRGLSDVSLMQARLLVQQTSQRTGLLERTWNPRQTTYTIGRATKAITSVLELASRVNRRITELEEDIVIATVTDQLEAMRADIQGEMIKKIAPHSHTIAAARQAGQTDDDLISLPTLRRDVLAFLRVLEGIQQSLVYLIEEQPVVAGAILRAFVAIDAVTSEVLGLLLDLFKASVELTTWTLKHLPWIIGGGVVLLGGFILLRRRGKA